jgi:hypothetical protein
MWGTIVGGILGFLGALLPKVVELFQTWIDHRNAHATTAQQIDAAQKGVTVTPAGRKIAVEGEGVVVAPGIPPELANTSALDDSEDTQAPVAIVPTCTFFGKLINMLAMSVRPIVTYGFFAVFMVIKLQGLYHGMIEDQTPMTQLLPVIWDEGTESLFAAVLAFWFGSRAFEKSKALTGKAS